MVKEKRENKPLITTIIPTYRRPKLLKRAILSVLNQTYPNFQVCIYDNASGDETAEIVKELAEKDSRIKYHCYPKNIGVKTLNFGLSKINTLYFSILSDDDILLPDFYEKALNGFQRYPEASFIATQTIITTEKEIKGISFNDYEEKLYQFPQSLLKMSDWKPSTWTGILFRKEVIKKIGLFDEQIGGSGDVDFLLRISSVFPYGVVKSPGAIFYVNKLSLSSNWSMIEQIEGFKRILEKVKNSEVVPVLIRKIVYQNLKRNIVQELWKGGLMDVKKRRFFEATKLSESLKNDFDENLKAIIIYNCARFCELSNIFYGIFFNLDQMRRFLKPNRRTLQKAYKPYLKYFEKYST